MINLLPPKQKEILLKEKQFRQTIIFGLMIIFCFFFFCLILLLIAKDMDKKLMVEQFLLKKEQEKFALSEAKTLEEKITQFNKIILGLNSYYKNDFYLSDIFFKLAEIKPSQIYLTDFSYNSNDKKITLFGVAATRSLLSEFKEQLEKTDIFYDIYFPASNWIKSKDINFFIEAKIKTQ